MDNKVFAILHEFEESQFLVTGEYDDQEDVYKVKYKFWCEEMGGHATIGLCFKTEEGFSEAFEQFRDTELCKRLMQDLVKQTSNEANYE